MFTENKRPQSFLVDSNIWVALYSETDPLHSKATQIVLQNNQRQTYITNLILAESLTVLSMRAGRTTAIVLGKTFYEQTAAGTLAILYLDATLERQTWELFQKTTQKNISFVDCASAVVARHWGIDAILTFDRDFLAFKRQLGLNLIGI